MKEAQSHWPFLTNYDASTIKNELQLVRIVGDRTGRLQPEAEADVRAWLAGKDFGR